MAFTTQLNGFGSSVAGMTGGPASYSLSSPSSSLSSLAKTSPRRKEPRSPKEGGDGRKKARTPKVRTGCLACKRSHVKCCETKPHCKRCDRLNLVCQYTHLNGARREQALGALALRPLRPAPTQDQCVHSDDEKTQARDGDADSPSSHESNTSPTSSSSPTSVRSPGSSPASLIRPRSTSFSSEESFYLDIYRNCIASQLSRPDFWLRAVLRESERDESIRHCIVALGARFQAISQHQNQQPWTPSSSPISPIDMPSSSTGLLLLESPRHERQAVSHYTQSLSLFRGRLSRQGSSMPPRSILIITFLLIAFEVMQDNAEACDRLMTNAVLIIKSSLESLNSDGSWNSRVAAPVDDEGVHEAELLLIRFAGFSILSGRLHPEQGNIKLDPSVRQFRISMPDVNASCTEVEKEWDKFITSILVRAFRVHTACLDGTYSSDSVRTEQEIMLYQIRMWDSWIRERLVGIEHEAVPPSERRAITIIYIGVCIIHMFASCFLDRTELAWDAFLPQFREVIRLAQSVVDETVRESCSWPLLDDKLAPLLIHTIVGKCRDQMVREQGLALCRSISSLNGNWHSKSSIVATEVKVTVEQAGRDASGFIPPESRYLITQSVWNDDHTELTVGLTAVVPDQDGNSIQKDFIVRPDEFGFVDRRLLMDEREHEHDVKYEYEGQFFDEAYSFGTHLPVTTSGMGDPGGFVYSFG